MQEGGKGKWTTKRGEMRKYSSGILWLDEKEVVDDA